MAGTQGGKPGVSQPLPKPFLMKMKGLLGEEYEAFWESCSKERVQGLRLNPLKVGSGEGAARMAQEAGLRKIPWAREGYYYGKEVRPGKHALHEAGVYYIQEPSAMAAAELLGPEPGDKVLDLCGAPGGKSAQIAGRLLGKGFLLSNELYPVRARILSRNIERMGIGNAVAASEEARTLAGRFPGFFNKILVDAPCSGEGMFRKDEEARRQWSQGQVELCAKRQGELLDCAAVMLCPGGRLVYSTCTFSPEENEGSVCRFLKRNPEFTVEKAEAYESFGRGRPEWTEGGQRELEYTFRLWPHMLEGEGHYIAVLRKGGPAAGPGIKKQRKPDYVKDRQVKAIWREFAKETLSQEGLMLFGKEEEGRLALFGEQLYLVPEEMPDFQGLRILRPGLQLGSLKKNRFEPSHSLALFLRKEHVKRWEARDAEGGEMAAYLRGEALEVSEKENMISGSGNGWTLMLADGYSIGWAKRVGHILKNHYPKGLRRVLGD